MRRAGASMPPSKSHEELAKHTIFEYEEFEWRKFRTFSAKGDSPAGALGDKVKQVTAL
jgi:hypothetical protein